MIGCVGRDHFAAPALATLKNAGVDTSNITEVETPTGCATICVDANAENAIVVASGANREVRATQVPDALPRRLAERHNLTCVLTLGRKGAVVYGPGGGFSIPALPVEPLDSTGAGDTFIGVMAAGLDTGLPTAEAARRASAAAAIACTKPGAQTGIPVVSEINDALKRLSAAQPT
jgi:ribokinase